MEKILRDSEYLKHQKKKYSFYTLLVLGSMLTTYGFGIWLTKTPKNIFTIIAIFLILGVAQLGVRLIVYLPYKDPSKKWLSQFEKTPLPYVLWNSALLTNGKNNIFFDGILIGDSSIHCLSQNKPSNSRKSENAIIYIFERKGLDNKINFVYGDKNIRALISTLQENKTMDLSQQKEYIKIIQFHSL
ncbi:MAG: hypothetical protein GX962_04460 [Epulopiscium sp.]|nr:hypothetical protein [Candidatus Epulonipiscium sp.]